LKLRQNSKISKIQPPSAGSGAGRLPTGAGIGVFSGESRRRDCKQAAPVRSLRRFVIPGVSSRRIAADRAVRPAPIQAARHSAQPGGSCRSAKRIGQIQKPGIALWTERIGRATTVGVPLQSVPLRGLVSS